MYGTCDKGGCTAGARVKVTLLTGGQLQFCGHHAKEAWKPLEGKFLVWDDADLAAMVEAELAPKVVAEV